MNNDPSPMEWFCTRKFPGIIKACLVPRAMSFFIIGKAGNAPPLATRLVKALAIIMYLFAKCKTNGKTSETTNLKSLKQLGILFRSDTNSWREICCYL